MSTFRRRGGYIFVETLVSMGLLSISMIFIQAALRQAIMTRGQSEDYTTARFLMERIVSERSMILEQQEGQGQGTFETPFERFHYEWKVSRITIPQPPLPPNLTEAEVKSFFNTFKGGMGKLYVRIAWVRSEMAFEVKAETLLSPEKLWIPPEMRPQPLL